MLKAGVEGAPDEPGQLSPPAPAGGQEQRSSLSETC